MSSKPHTTEESFSPVRHSSMGQHPERNGTGGSSKIYARHRQASQAVWLKVGRDKFSSTELRTDPWK